MGQLNGKVALITGGTSGIGLATARRFVEEGAQVFITGRRQAELDKAVASLGKNVTGVRGDVTKQSDLDHLFDVIKNKAGHLDVVFANAGGGTFAPLGAITEKHYQEIFDLNVKGVIFTVQKALPLLKDGSSVILTASTAGTQGMEAFSVYAATKAAVRSFARSWTTDLKKRKIRVNAISPGVVPTAGYKSLMNDDQIRQFADYMATTQIPMGRVREPAEIADPVVFLASDASRFVTGVELFVDGGMTAV